MNLLYMAELAKRRRRIHDLLVYGELVDYDILDNVSMPSTCVRSGDETFRFETTATHAALWRNSSGDFALVMTNPSDEI